jgi:hypothetical protein
MPYRRRDSPFWWVKFTRARGEEPTYRSTGTTDRKEAEALEAKWRLEAYQEEKWGIQPEHSFEELMVRYINATRDEMRSPERVGYAVKRLQPFFEGKLVERLRRSDISAYIEQRKASGVGPATINRELDTLSAAINFARKKWDWEMNNPVSGMSLKEPEGRLCWIRRAEADALIREAERDAKSPHPADFIRLALNRVPEERAAQAVMGSCGLAGKPPVPRARAHQERKASGGPVERGSAKGHVGTCPFSCRVLPGFALGVCAQERGADAVHAERLPGGVPSRGDREVQGS